MNVLTKPYTKEEIEEYRFEQSGYLYGVVEVDLLELMQASWDEGMDILKKKLVGDIDMGEDFDFEPTVVGSLYGNKIFVLCSEILP